MLLDCLLGFLFMWAGYPITATLPGGVAAAVAVIAVGVFRPSTLKVKWGSLLFLLGMALLVFLVAVSMLNGQPWTQRIGKFALLLLLCSVLATGRINVRSLVIGGCLGAVVNVPLFYAGIAPNNYPPYLTGFYGDKNVAGLYYVVWGHSRAPGSERSLHEPRMGRRLLRASVRHGITHVHRCLPGEHLPGWRSAIGWASVIGSSTRPSASPL
ncbi:hypothetical protein FV141_09890 [Dermacoccus abyssi]|uniref:Uncharacterized protein n=1 Tax=Dermacoccus abyssi TaxID=322596 RepID=A0ABX5ZA12_9MICO|nr:hypothetical protein FV141_09890 [Dermacoccus abyssi]